MEQLIGQNVIIRTVTNYFTGKLQANAGGFLELTDAAWIADTGRWAQALTEGKLAEVEPYPDGQLVLVSAGAVIDVTEWTHELPRKQL